MIFLGVTFVYMNIIILYKWLAYDSTKAACAPSILIMLINMFLMKYQDAPCYLAPMYAGQRFFQTLLVLTALICIPWMLFVKPWMLKKQHEAKLIATVQSNNLSNRDGYEGGDQVTISMDHGGGHGGHGDGGEFNYGETLIYQAIHTIEYCLGAVSHTASYLRLWALSLAHSQLSEVLWNMVLRFGLGGSKITGGFIMYFTFAFWAGATVAVLLLMEGLSAFLHALRLHWVEFQSKFFHGEGYLFQPFSFEAILEQESEEST